MSDDLVDELREAADQWQPNGFPNSPLLRNAADEIESLRVRLSAAEAERDALRSAAGELYEHTRFDESVVVQSCRKHLYSVLGRVASGDEQR